MLRLCRSVAHITTSVVVVCFEDFDSSGDRCIELSPSVAEDFDSSDGSCVRVAVECPQVYMLGSGN